MFCDTFFFAPCCSTSKNFKLAAAGDSAIESRVIIVDHRYISQENVLGENLLSFIKELIGEFHKDSAIDLHAVWGD